MRQPLELIEWFEEIVSHNPLAHGGSAWDHLVHHPDRRLRRMVKNYFVCFVWGGRWLQLNCTLAGKVFAYLMVMMRDYFRRASPALAGPAVFVNEVEAWFVDLLQNVAAMVEGQPALKQELGRLLLQVYRL